MSYNVNYDLYDMKGHVTKRRQWPCFSEFYNYGKGTFRNVDVMVLKNYPKLSSSYVYNSMPFTSEEVHEYVRLLKSMGFKFEFREQETEYVFSIYFDCNSRQAYKTLLNCIRHLHEYQGPEIVGHFLRFSKQRIVGLTNFAKLQLACHCKEMSNYGHTFLIGASPQMLLSKSEFHKLILTNDENGGVSTTIPAGKKYFRNTQDWTDLKKLFSDKEPLKVILKKYKELCVKYT